MFLSTRSRPTTLALSTLLCSDGAAQAVLELYTDGLWTLCGSDGLGPLHLTPSGLQRGTGGG